MDQKQIQYLLEKQSSGSISPEELGELYLLLNSTEKANVIELFSDHVWSQASSSENTTVSNKSWENIQKSIAPSITVGERSSTRSIGFQILKYAAIILITVGLTWLFFNARENGFKHQLAFNEFRVPYGSKSTLILPDGTKIWMNSGSRIRYPEKFAPEDRTIYLEGEAFFDVTHNPKRPFIVKTSDINIKVYGTRFNVKSFPEESIIETALVSGSVEIERTNSQGKVLNNIRMQPNQIVSYSKMKGDFVSDIPVEKPKEEHKVVAVASAGKVNEVKPIVPVTVIDLVTSWKDEKLLFKKENFEDIIIKMQRWYDVKITLQNENLKKCTFTGTFDKETVEQALDALRLTYPFTFTINKNIIVIK
jgi:ferric-dicitrate binding protein FerR (iron transport regulator)